MSGIIQYIRRTGVGLFNTIAALLRSRKYLIMLSALGAAILCAYIPALQPFYDYIFVLILTTALTNIGGIAFEDAHKTAQETPPLTGKTGAEIVEGIVDELIKDAQNPLGEEHRAAVTTTVEAQVVSKPAAP